MKEKTLVILAGPTAVGKTALAIQLAQHFNTSIISADARQCYRELNIAVAKPTPDELASVPHYFINSHSIHDTVHAALFEKLALKWADEIFLDHDIAIMTGGTGLYIKAFREGLDKIPQVDASVRSKIIENYNQHGLTWLQEEIKKNDPAFYTTGEMQNPQRMMRALEVVESTGQSINAFRTQAKKKRPFRIVNIALELPREELYDRVNRRVDEMVEKGLEQEAKSLSRFRLLPALQTVGYRELFAYFDGHISYQDAINQIKMNTRHYAKRQLTWLRRDLQMQWTAPLFDRILAKI